MALMDLNADCHALASELASARDHLSRLAAIHAGAPSDVDSLAHLRKWVNKPANSAHATEPLVQLLLSASGTNVSWLRRLGDIRNEMLHRIPMGANERASGLVLHEHVTTYGSIQTIRLGPLLSANLSNNLAPDPLVELSQLSTDLEHLCRDACQLAKYPAVLPQFTIK
jgi:hypothetical protein